ncbi:FMN-binding protein [bacterium]|nr:FMN-binding protein [bacterium]
MKEKPWYPIAYMFVVTAVPSALLIGLSEATRERVRMNERIAFEHAVLLAVDPALPADMPKKDIHERFVEQVDTNTADAAGALKHMRDGAVAAYALPIAGQGFWAPIKGVVAVDAGRQRILGISFYEQSETPGLGAEIAQDWFRVQFTNVAMDAGPAPVPFKYKGKAGGKIDAVTGGTQTSTRLERFLNAQLAAWRERMEGGDR